MKSTVKSREPAVEISAHTRFSTRHILLFLLCWALFFCSQFYRASTAIIAPQLQKDLGLSSESLGSLSAAFFYAFAVMQIPLALLLDRLGARLLMSVLTLVAALGSLLFAMSEGYLGAMAGRVLLGLGLAGNLMGGMKLFSQWFSPREFATLAGLLTGAGTLGNIAASSPLALLVEQIGWKAAFFMTGAATAVLAVLFYSTIRDGPFPAAQSALSDSSRSQIAADLRTLLLNRDYWLISCGTFFRYGTVMAIQGLWAGPYLMACFRLSAIEAGNIISLTTIGYVAGCSIGGWLSDRVLRSRKKVVILGMTGMAGITACLSFSWGQGHCVFQAFTFLALGLFAGFGNVMYAHIKGRMPPEMAGMALTGINFFTMLGVGTYIHLMGWMIGLMPPEKQAGPEGYGAAFCLALAGITLATVLYGFTHESKEFAGKSG